MIRNQYIIYACGFCLLGLMLGLGTYNAAAYFKAGLTILGVIAIASELIGFIMAVVVEIAAKEKRPVAAAVCGGILLACAAFNIFGGERAWHADMESQREAGRMSAQGRLDTQRAALQTDLAAAERNIARFDHLLPTPETVSYRQAGLQRAWDGATADYRETRDKAQAELDALPVVAEAPPEATPYDPLMVQYGFAVAEVIKVLGLWACGFASLGAAATIKRPEETFGNETNLERTQRTCAPETKETLQETVRRLRNDLAWSYGRIESATGVAKGTAWRWCNPAQSESLIIAG